MTTMEVDDAAGSPENQVPLALSPTALAQRDANAMPANAPPVSVGKKTLDVRFRSPTDSNMSPASKFVNAKKGGKLRAGCVPSQLEGNFSRQAPKPAAGTSRFGASAPASRFAPR